MPPTILLPLGGTDDTDRAAEYALERAASEDAVVHALFVVDTGRYGEPALSSAEVLVDDREDAGKRELAAVAARGAARGVDVQTRCCHGRPNAELLGYAESVGADVVVLDRRVPHGVRHGLAATVGAEVVRPTDRTVTA